MKSLLIALTVVCGSFAMANEPAKTESAPAAVPAAAAPATTEAAVAPAADAAVACDKLQGKEHAKCMKKAAKAAKAEKAVTK
jgi:hypothetical protein